MIKNIDKNRVFDLAQDVTYQPGQVVSKTITKSDKVNISLFAFDKGEGLSKHTTNGDAMVMILDGVSEITIGEDVHQVKAGQTIVLPATIPHALLAVERFKMLIVIVF